jgi:hypothetical protein
MTADCTDAAVQVLGQSGVSVPHAAGQYRLSAHGACSGSSIDFSPFLWQLSALAFWVRELAAVFCFMIIPKMLLWEVYFRIASNFYFIFLVHEENYAI